MNAGCAWGAGSARQVCCFDDAVWREIPREWNVLSQKLETSFAASPATIADGGRLGACIDLGLWFAAVVLLILADQLISQVFSMTAVIARALGVIQLGLMFLLTTGLVRWRGETWRKLAFNRPVTIPRIAVLVCSGYVVAVCINAAILMLVLPAFKAAPPKLGVFGAIKGDAGLYLYWVAFAWISAAIGEELQFRAFLWSRLERLLGPGRGAVLLAMAGQAVVFGFAHIYQGLSGVPATASLGFVMGAISLAARRNLAACMILHGLIDTVSLTVAFAVGLPPTMNR